MTQNRSCATCGGLFPADTMTRRQGNRYCADHTPKQRTVGSDGKLITAPTKKQATFTKYGTPVGTEAFLGYNYKYQIGPKEQKYIKTHGTFSKLGPGKYIEEPK